MYNDGEEEQDFLSMAPINFFAIEWSCPMLGKSRWSKGPAKLPSMEKILGEEHFADLFMGWSSEGLRFLAKVESPVKESQFPNPEKGDSIELFIDTRDVKDAGFNHRFCHHFCFTPERVEGFNAQEMTRFRTEDVHPLCDPKDLQAEVKQKKGGYEMEIFIPRECLHGFDPAQFDRIGFTYRINRKSASSQHFSLDSSEYQLDQHPAQWASVKLV